MKAHLLVLALGAVISASGSEHLLWSDAECRSWTDMYPVGNGWMGAMVDAARTTHLQFNLSRIWSGRPHCYDRAGAGEALLELRQAVFEGRGGDANRIFDERVVGDPKGQARYQPCGDLWVELGAMGELSLVRRRLELDNARHVSMLTNGELKVAQETFAPYTEKDFIIHRIVANKPGALDCRIVLRSAHGASSHFVKGNVAGFTGEVEEGGVKFASLADVSATGDAAAVEREGDGIRVRSADAVEIRLTAASDMKSWKALSGDPLRDCENALERLRTRTFKEIRAAHRKAYGRLYNRVQLDLHGSDASDVPTLERLRRQREERDPGFAELVFNYGRYLLISSSRADGDPANLQGIWNPAHHPAWGSKYTCNINVEMKAGGGMRPWRMPPGAVQRHRRSLGVREADGQVALRGGRLGGAPQFRWLARHRPR